MNIVITLPKDLIEKIISGKKKYEMRKCLPKSMKIGVDGFFVIEKGTDNVRCWCRVDGVQKVFFDYFHTKLFAPRLCVSESYIMEYAFGKSVYMKSVYLWKIGKVKTFEHLKREELLVDRNPQSFAYAPLSWGESF